MSVEELKGRTKRFALEVLMFAKSLPRGPISDVLGRQMMRSGTSVGANYRAACRAKSNADFVSKMGTVEEELDETMYWMEMLVEAGIVRAEKTTSLMKEANQLLAITVASIRTARRR
ncbi:MAG: four helix bundle protein [Acidobacteriota bacterium]